MSFVVKRLLNKFPNNCICDLLLLLRQELLAAFVASRSKGSADEESDSPPPDLPPKKSSSHPQRPQLQPVQQQQSSSETRPILSVDRETGIIAVDQMWTCSKCSFAYNKIAADKCDICTSSR